MQCMTSAVVIVLLVVMIVESHPICNYAATNEPTCYTNLTANVSFLNEWLSLHDNSEGINQLRGRMDNTIVKSLLQLTTSTVILNVMMCVLYKFTSLIFV